MPAASKSTWISAKGRKHRLDVATGHTVCGLRFKTPYPECDRTDPMCKECIGAKK